jgi:uncharacterized membrane protein
MLGKFITGLSPGKRIGKGQRAFQMISDVTFQVLWTIFVFLVVFNFLPACIAFVSRHPERRVLALLNVLSLFSFALWIALMVWAVGGQRPDSTIGKLMGSERGRNLVRFCVAGMVAFGMGSAFGGLGIV